MAARKKILDVFRKILPPLSATEKEALESGTVSWDGELMKGKPDWNKLFDFKKPELTAEEQAFLDGPTEELCKLLDKWQIQQDSDLPKEAWDLIKKEGFMGLEIPKEYGGKGFSSQAHSAIVMKLSTRSITGAVTVMVPNSLGPAELIHEYGTKDQKDYYLPRLAKGEEIPCFALTGPEAGSDAANIPDRGIVCKNEKGELGIKLTFEKRYITLAPIATLIGMAFKMEDPDGLLGNKKDLGINVALVPRDTPGMDIGERHKPMDLPFMNGPLRGKDVFIPIDNLVGGRERAGQGWKMLMECLAVGRSLSLPAQSVAGAKLSSYATGSYARVRRQFNTSISKFEGIEEVLARMAGATYMMNAARLFTLQMVDQGEKPAVPSAIVKYHLTENMRKIVNDAMDIHGGKGICNGPANVFADIYKGIPVAITVEGANIMTRNLIVFGQGSVRSHPYVLKQLEALSEKDDKVAFKKFSKSFFGHVGNALANTARSFIYGITRGRFSKVPKNVDPATKQYYRQVNRLSASFNLASNAAIATLGGNLKVKERTSARLGDVYSNLYLATATLWHYEQQGRPKEDLPLVHWACTHALHQAEKAMDDLLRNYPVKGVGAALRPLIFPTGKQTKAPNDRMDRKAADTIREPGPARDRMKEGIYLPTDYQEPLGKLEIAFKASIETEALEKKLRDNIKSKAFDAGSSRTETLENAVQSKIITEEERKALVTADKVRRDVIMVDSFPQTAPVAANNNKKEEQKTPKAKP